VTLLRERLDQGKRSEAGDPRSLTPRGTIRGGIRAGMREGASVHYHGADHPLLATPVSLTMERRHLQVAICRKAAGVPPDNGYCGTVPAGPRDLRDGSPYLIWAATAKDTASRCSIAATTRASISGVVQR
jgi:hypothetical protein